MRVSTEVNYAFWRKCDFQIHTPRDPNWKGTRPVGKGDRLPTSELATNKDIESARSKWASEFVDACIKRDLKAVALTDHHETVMVPFVRAEIEKRKKADPKFDLWLFPGMELTASGGYQCLMLFDADIPDDLCREVRSCLGIADSSLKLQSAKSTTVTQLKMAYPDLATELKKLNSVAGRFIILPNVSRGNNNTVLKKGGHTDFRRAPYVGGYLDRGQTIETLNSTNRKRLSGNDPNWSVREIYPLPTSDSRTEDFASLGTNQTWIKLAEPTAEAIRQAFLGHPSRIRIKPPHTPALAVTDIEIEGSTILGRVSLALSRELNSIIGGRGSGKSSFLEYLSFGLGRSCFDTKREEYSGSSRLQDLVVETLTSKSGLVKLTLLQDDAIFKISRDSSNKYQPQVTYPDGSVQNMTSKELRSLFPSVVYGQGELAEIGKQTGKKTQLSDLLQFVDPDYKRQDDSLLNDIETAKKKVLRAIQIQEKEWSLQAKRRKLIAERSSLQQRGKALEKTLPELSKQDQATIEQFAQAEAFESQRIQASKHADQILQELGDIISRLQRVCDLSAAQSNEAKIVRQHYDDLFKAFDSGTQTLKTDIKKYRSIIADAEEIWTDSFKEISKQRDKILAKLSDHKVATDQIKKLQEEISGLNNRLGNLEIELKSTGDPAVELKEAIIGLQSATDVRMERTKQWAKEIEKLSNGKIKARVDEAGDVSEIEEAIESVAKQTGSKEVTRVRELEKRLESHSVWVILNHLREDCLALLRWQFMGSTTGEEQPSADDLTEVIGSTDRIRKSLIERLDVFRVGAIATAVPKPKIALSYCDGDSEISFEKASEGQRAAALLFMLLEQPGGPLVIDQPEGDLDNKIIAELTEKLHHSKQKRQLIFASHNANIVVNGSSELVGYLDINDAGSRQFECVGAIDRKETCDAITTTMEGGEKAFKDRYDKYGY